MKRIPLVLLSAFMVGCAAMPRGARPVSSFDASRYLGRWYEIARLDFRFERNLDNTTAEYMFDDDGSIRVVNRGYNTMTGKWQEAVGRARLVGAPGTGRLEVSFFGPFYSPYNVIALDSEYRYALVAGKNLDYLWILAREPVIPEEIKTAYLKIAEDVGYETSDLIWPAHDRSPDR